MTLNETTPVFVTGGSGFVGGAAILELVARGIPVRALARSGAAAEKVRALGAGAGAWAISAAWRQCARGCRVASR
ncbi:MAG: hypothetical protein WDN04_22800 [Rhodospirillales bacterium]